jgi:hypothetical protein
VVFWPVVVCYQTVSSVRPRYLAYYAFYFIVKNIILFSLSPLQKQIFDFIVHITVGCIRLLANLIEPGPFSLLFPQRGAPLARPLHAHVRPEITSIMADLTNMRDLALFFSPSGCNETRQNQEIYYQIG